MWNIKLRTYLKYNTQNVCEWKTQYLCEIQDSEHMWNTRLNIYVKYKAQNICEIQDSDHKWSIRPRMYVKCKTRNICEIQDSEYMWNTRLRIYVKYKTQNICEIQHPEYTTSGLRNTRLKIYVKQHICSRIHRVAVCRRALHVSILLFGRVSLHIYRSLLCVSFTCMYVSFEIVLMHLSARIRCVVVSRRALRARALALHLSPCACWGTTHMSKETCVNQKRPTKRDLFVSKKTYEKTYHIQKRRTKKTCWLSIHICRC